MFPGGKPPKPNPPKQPAPKSNPNPTTQAPPTNTNTNDTPAKNDTKNTKAPANKSEPKPPKETPAKPTKRKSKNKRKSKTKSKSKSPKKRKKKTDPKSNQKAKSSPRPPSNTQPQPPPLKKTPSKAKIITPSPKPGPQLVKPALPQKNRSFHDDYVSRKYPLTASAPQVEDFQEERQFYGTNEMPQTTDDANNDPSNTNVNTPASVSETGTIERNSSSRSSKAPIESPATSQIHQLSEKSPINENASRVPSEMSKISAQSPISKNQSRIPSEMNQLSAQSPVSTSPPRNQSQIQENTVQSPPSKNQSRIPSEINQLSMKSPPSKNQSRIPSEMNQFTVQPPMPMPMSVHPSEHQSQMQEMTIQSPIISKQQSRQQSQSHELSVKSRMSPNESIIQSQMSQLKVESPVPELQSRYSSQLRDEFSVQPRISNSPPIPIKTPNQQSQRQILYPAPIPVDVQSTHNQNPAEELKQPNVNFNSDNSHQYSFANLSNSNPEQIQKLSKHNSQQPVPSINTSSSKPTGIDFYQDGGHIVNWDDNASFKIFETQKGDDPEEHKLVKSEEEIMWNPGFICYVLLITSLTHYVYFALCTISSHINILPENIGYFFWVPLLIFVIISICSGLYAWSRELLGSILVFLIFVILWAIFWTLLALFLSPSPIVASIVECIATNCFILAVFVRIKGNFNLKSGTIYILAVSIILFHFKIKVAMDFVEFFETRRKADDFGLHTVEKILIKNSISNAIGGITFLYICFELQAILLGNRPVAWPTQCIYGALSLYEDIIWVLFELAQVIFYSLIYACCLCMGCKMCTCCSCKCKNRRNFILKG